MHAGDMTRYHWFKPLGCTPISPDFRTRREQSNPGGCHGHLPLVIHQRRRCCNWVHFSRFWFCCVRLEPVCRSMRPCAHRELLDEPVVGGLLHAEHDLAHLRRHILDAHLNRLPVELLPHVL